MALPAVSAAQSAINRLQKWPRSNHASAFVTDQCPVLQDTYAWTVDMRPVRVCPSGHVVSVEAAIQMLKANRLTCPICRQPMTLNTLAPFETPEDFEKAKDDPSSGLHLGGRRQRQRQGRDGRFVSSLGNRWDDEY